MNIYVYELHPTLCVQGYKAWTGILLKKFVEKKDV